MPSTAPADMLIFRHHIYLDDFRLWQWSGICHFRAHLAQRIPDIAVNRCPLGQPFGNGVNRLAV